MDHTNITTQTPQPKKARIILGNLTDSQKQNLKIGALGLGAFGTGAALTFVPGLINDHSIMPANSENMMDVACVDTNAPFSECDYDNFSFSDAFNQARADVGRGGLFEWKGNTYNTYKAEEWDNMTAQEKDNYWTSIENDTNIKDFNPVTPNVENTPDAELVAETAGETTGQEASYGFADTDKDHIMDLMGVDINGDGFADHAFIKGVDGSSLYIDTDNDHYYDQIIVDDYSSDYDKVYTLEGEDLIKIIDMDKLYTLEEANAYHAEHDIAIHSVEETTDENVENDFTYHEL